MYFNAQGLTSNINQLKIAITNVYPKIILLSETHLTEDISDGEINICNYNLYRTNSTSRHTGGVAIYINNQIQVLRIEKSVVERNAWFLAIKIKWYDLCVIVACVYHSPNSCHNTFIHKIDEWLQSVNEKNEKIILIGDMNINWYANTSNKKKLHDCIYDNNMCQLVESFTRVNNNDTRTLIDYCISNISELHVKTSPENNISDHECIVCECLVQHANDMNKYKAFEYMRKYEQYELLNELYKFQWTNAINLNFSEKCIFLENALKLAVKPFIKIKQIPINAKCKWYDKNLSDLKKMRDISYTRAQLTNENDDWLYYRYIRNKYVDQLRLNESQYYKNKIQENTGDKKNMWKILKQVMGQKKRSEIKAICFDGTTERDEKVIAEKLNAFFVDSIRTISNSIPSTTNGSASNIQTAITSIFKFHAININDINEAIKQINSKGDIEKITPQVLIDALPVIGDLFCNIINESLHCGIFPDWKCSTITPIEKVTSSTKPEDMRPINNMKSMEKVLEIIVKKQLDNYVNDNNILVECQSGFRKNHSCETAINYVVQNWKDEIEKKKIILCVFLDLKRAFETIDRDLMIRKLIKIGINGNELKWFESFINDRKQKTKINNAISSEIVNDIGLAQGTVLATLLFILYINDIIEIKKNKPNVQIQLFADDTLIYLIIDNINNLSEGISELNNVLNDVNKYLIENKLKLNVNKTKAMIIGCKKTLDKSNIELKIENEKIEIVNHIKYLGMYIDEKLDLNEHVDYLCNKVSKKVGVLNRLRKKLDIEEKKCIYKTIIAPHFDYCSSILFLCNEGQFYRMQKLQNRSMRAIIDVNKYTSVNLMLDALNWLNIRQRITLLTLKLVHKMCLGITPPYLNKFIERRGETHGYNLRNDNNLNLKKVNKKSTQNSLIYKGFKMYNDLPNEIKNETRMEIFTRTLTEWIKLNIR